MLIMQGAGMSINSQSSIKNNYVHTHAHTHRYVSGCKEIKKPHLATKSNLATSHLKTPLSYTKFTSQTHKY